MVQDATGKRGLQPAPDIDVHSHNIVSDELLLVAMHQPCLLQVAVQPLPWV
jgi:hypothetical protein